MKHFHKKSFIIIAEDDPDDRFLLQSALKDSNIHDGYEFVENGVLLMQTLNSLKSNEPNFNNFPNFILLDLNMPKKDGREVLQEIKSDPMLKKIPIIVFTTTKNDNEISRCYALGANSYIVKPLSYGELISVIKMIWDYWLNVSIPPVFP